MRSAHVRKTHAAQDGDYDKANDALTMSMAMISILVGRALSST